MKKRGLFIVMFLLAFLFYREGMAFEKKQTLEGSLLYMIPSESSLDRSLGWGMAYALYIHPSFSIQFFLGYHSLDKDSKKSSGGHLRMIPLEFSLFYHWEGRKTVCPYLGGGVGYYRTDFDPDNPLEDLGFKIDRSFKDLSFHLNAGMDIPIKQRVLFHVEIKYLLLGGGDEMIRDIFSGEETRVKDKIDLNSFSLIFGIKRAF